MRRRKPTSRTTASFSSGRLPAGRWVAILLATVLLVPSLRSQQKVYSIAVKGNLTTSSRLYHAVDAPDEFVRSQYIEVNDIWGYGIDIRRTIEDTRLQIGLSVEYLSGTESASQMVGSTSVPVEDGFWTVPVELSGYFIIPFSSEIFKLYIGGGGGVYVGKRTYSKGNEQADVVDSRNGFGIHIATGLEYSFASWLSVRSEVKFRDLQFESTKAFSRSSTTYRGVTVPLDQTPSRARINVDGMLVDAGLVVRF